MENIDFSFLEAISCFPLYLFVKDKKDAISIRAKLFASLLNEEK
jgi:hypothetical protein